MSREVEEGAVIPRSGVVIRKGRALLFGLMNSDPANLLTRVIIILALACLPLSLVLLSYIWQAHNQVYLQKEQEARYLLDHIATSESAFLVRGYRYLQDLVQSRELQDLSPHGCSTFLSRMLSFNPDFTNLSVAIPNGQLVCSAEPTRARANVADQDFFQQALSDKPFVITTAAIDQASKQKRLILALPFHDLPKQRIKGVLFASLSMEYWSLRLGVSALPQDASVVIVDENKIIVGHYPPNGRVIGLFSDSYGYDTRSVSQGTQITVQHSNSEGGEPHLQAYKYLSLEHNATPLIVGVSLSLSTTRHLAGQRLRQGLLWLGLSLLLLGVSVFLWLRMGVVRPLLRLQDDIQSLDQGDEKLSSLVHGPSEIRALQSKVHEIAHAHQTLKSDLKESESRFKLIGETIQEVFWVVTPDWSSVLYVNSAYEYVWQRSVESLYHQPLSWITSIVREDRGAVVNYIRSLAEEGYTNIVFPLYRIERRDGTVRWISAKGFPAYDDAGKLTSVVGIAEDVTERKQYEIELTQREAKYRLLVEHAEDLVVKVDLEGRFLFVSPSYCRTFGKSEHQLLGKAFLPLVHEEDQAATAEAMKALYYPPFKVYLEQRAMTIQGWRWFGWSDIALLDDNQEVTEIIGVGRDITRQKEVEFALRESESRNRELVDNMSDGVAVYQQIGDSDGFVFTNFNHAAERISGYTREQVLGKRVEDAFPGIRELGLLDVISNVAATGKPQHHPLEAYHDDRIQLWVENYVFKLPSGEVVAVFRDLTNEHVAAEALKKSEEKFRGFFEDLSVGLVIADQEGLVQEANKAFCSMFNIDRDELIGASFTSLLNSGADADVSVRLQELLDGRCERYRFQKHYEVGSEHRLVADVSIGLLRDDLDGRALFYGIVEDVTALEKAQEESDRLQRELMRTYRLEALGRLAGGIAHDFNNILGAITGFVELAASRLGEADEKTIRGYLDKSEQNSERAKQLIKQLLIFSSGPDQQTAEPQDFNRVISGSMDMIRSLLPASITMNLHQAEEQFRVVCDPVQIEQILLNLCINARDAMDGKGDLSLLLGRYHADNDQCVICPKRVEGDWVSLLVRDSGKGISDTEMEHIFEPFFTTKGRDQGTGLGLSVVQGIVASYNGHILVERDAQQGTAFRVLLPEYDERTVQSNSEGEVEKETDEKPDGSGVSLLVVDDELSMRQLLEEAFTTVGYEVTLCHDGAEAWELLQDPLQRFDLLLTDQTMPHLTGLDLIEKMRSHGNDIPVILCTGYSDLVNEQLLKSLNIDHYLRKPLRLTQLISYVRRLVAERRTLS